MKETSSLNNLPLIYRISHKNINNIKFEAPQKFKTILFDSNLNCNLHCIYCHNDRTTTLVKEEDFINFIETQVYSVETFQLGCAMEPTLDKRMVKFASIVSKSKAKPSLSFRLQTNGILLHRHNVDGMREAGINKITISIDTIDPEVHKEMRGGSDVFAILKNISDLRSKWPESKIHFVTTVYKKNINLLDDLCKYAIDNNISNIEFRKMFYYEDSNIIKDHALMKALLLTDEEFNDKIKKIKSKYEKNIEFYVNDWEKIKKDITNTKT